MVKEKLAAIGKPLRKFASTPNLAAAVRVTLCCLFVCLFVCLSCCLIITDVVALF